MASPYPMWTLAHGATSEEKDLLSAVIILKNANDGSQSIPIFSNAELAERFASERAMDGVIAVPLESAASLREWLPGFPDDGVEYVSLNPVLDPERWGGQATIAEFLDSLPD